MDIHKLLEGFLDKRVAIIGDIMLDRYIYGSVNRISPEAPVPVVKQEAEFFNLGGAANVAANVSSLYGKSFLFGYTGDDKERDILMNELCNNEIEPCLIGVLDNTILKTRIGNSHYQIVRLDREQEIKVDKKIEEKLVQQIFEIKPDIIIVSDYAKGSISKNLISNLKNQAKDDNVRIIIDPKPKNMEHYKDVYLVTPNFKEALEMAGIEDNEKVYEAGRYLQDYFNSNIVLTRGKDGMTLFENNSERAVNFPTRAKSVYDITGAGDTVVASIALALCCGLSLEESANFANHAAGIVVSKKGTSTVSREELEELIEGEHKKLKSLEKIKKIINSEKQKGKKIVWTNGCFDILHKGHVRYLAKARELGDILVVGLNSDKSVRELKGKDRPVMSQDDRAEILSCLEQVDYITIFSEKTARNCLKNFQPDIYVKGNDYDLESMDQEERRIIEDYGGKLNFLDVGSQDSSSRYIEYIRKTET
jgi:D-beta-D-heptose 7-phosphate kinase/D-beta-D-heptose 1-phosphate adenosyltransferase